MTISCLGLNHTTSSIALREQLSLNEDAIRDALSRSSYKSLAPSFDEIIILSTCNRVELYIVSKEPAFAEIETFLSEISSVPTEDFHEHTYYYEDLDAVRHLFEVAAGLDSLVIGEPQILGQIVRALELARGQDKVGSQLNRLFQSAIHSGKRARTETAISRNPASVSSLACTLAEQIVHPLQDARVVILGAGEMAELAVEALRKRGTIHIQVINRSLERAQIFADRWKANVDTFENLEMALFNADILISSTGASNTILSFDVINKTMKNRLERPLVLIDIAVPRDIDPKANEIPNVRVFDIDNLNKRLEGALSERMTEVPQVHVILDEEVTHFESYLKLLEVLPLISEIHQHAEKVRLEMLNKTFKKFPDLTKTEQRGIEAMSLALVKKLLHEPTNRLRKEAGNTQALQYTELTRTLFNIQKENTSGDSGSSNFRSMALD